MSGKQHFVALDGLRGLAALAVVVHHATGPFDLDPIPNAGLAVDFFFALSGFVVAFAYEDRLKTARMSVVGFIRARVERLHPLIFLGVLFGAATFGANYVLIEGGDPGVIALAALFGALLIPFGGLFPGDISSHPLNPPSWSLFAEYVANLVYCLICRWLSNPLLGLVVLLAAVLEIYLVIANGAFSRGAYFHEWPLGLLRVIFPFFGGVGLFRLWRKGWLRRLQTPFCVLCAVLVLVFIAPKSGWFDLAAVFLIFPLVIAAGTHEIGSPRINSLANWSGRMSYPIYIMHYPLVWVFSAVARKLELSGPLLFGLITVEVAAMGVVAWLALKFYDEPVRKFLVRRRRPAITS